MNELQTLHHQSMSLADEADQFRRSGNGKRAQAALRKAFLAEQKAAALVAADVGFEPSRSILHRSAASLALECGLIREAEKLIATALAGEPPEEIAEELRDLLQQVHSQRRFAVRKVAPVERSTPVTIRGLFRFADGLDQKNGTIRVIDDDQKPHRIDVPEGMMDDIVRPLWGTRVIVRGRRTGNQPIELEDIQAESGE